MNITKKQHYIPQAILSYFTCDGCHGYESLLMKGNKLYKVHISNSMCERFLYEIKGLPINLVESYFANHIDGRLATFHREADQAISEGNIDLVRSIFEKHISDVLRCYYRSGAVLEEYRTGYPKGEVLLRVLSDTTTDYISSLSKTILKDYSFAVIANTDSGFIIGDCYLTTLALGIKSHFVNSSNRQIGLKNTMLILPVSQRYCLVLFSGDCPQYIEKNKVNFLTSNQSIEINLAILYSSYRKIFGAKQEVMTNLLKSFSSEYFGFSPITTMVGFESGRSMKHILKKEVFFYSRDYEIMKNIITILAAYYNNNLSRNSKCFCGSNKKLKHCCLEKFEIAMRINRTFSDNGQTNHRITQNSTVEKVIRIS